ncbi:hypothetical protein DCO58_05270 [Helicobacter saguini]|uniref:Uncharacterized protein n=1 Tax=Helicobacter saguini TaxID=1548018 RepID=A0A347VT48_9HELI|nr:hypothetical protein [Helicobacter saguini]MWV62240.1 hypothetical protein [Helicobacter saguini]MWV67087.1 hypothetical protein [Helicobacter saguini]MWV69437.1 hypothetical protein [Helicobacter saguini]MWV71010.1 hypothetical protein [Helicobacter saguini]TLD91756.1 hypothetical protein LS64_011395 [Helicobacter saguini]
MGIFDIFNIGKVFKDGFIKGATIEKMKDEIRKDTSLSESEKEKKIKEMEEFINKMDFKKMF